MSKTKKVLDENLKDLSERNQKGKFPENPPKVSNCCNAPINFIEGNVICSKCHEFAIPS